MTENKLITGDEHSQDHCGVVAAIFNNPNGEPLGIMLNSARDQHHRGQEAHGIVGIRPDSSLVVLKAPGLIGDNEKAIATIADEKVVAAIIHLRYSTAGITDPEGIQPYVNDNLITAHNGNFINPLELVAHPEFPYHSDTHAVHEALRNQPGPLEEKLKLLRRAKGAFSAIFADPNSREIVAARDPWGFRPLVYAQLPDNLGYAITSESNGLYRWVGGNLNEIHEIQPGQAFKFNRQGVTQINLGFNTDIEPAFCVFEYIYVLFPTSVSSGVHAYRYRFETGRALARRDIADGFIPDLIIPIRESGGAAGEGYADAIMEHLIAIGASSQEIRSRRASSAPIIPSRYAIRTFIEPGDERRKEKIKLKYNLDPNLIADQKLALADQKLALVDDSIVRGNTMRELNRELRRFGAKEVHIRAASPPIRCGCHYGIDHKEKELIAKEVPFDQIEKYVADETGTDSVKYLSLDEMWKIAMRLAGRNIGLCDACFTGNYPIPVDPDLMVNKTYD